MPASRENKPLGHLAQVHRDASVEQQRRIIQDHQQNKKQYLPRLPQAQEIQYAHLPKRSQPHPHLLSHLLLPHIAAVPQGVRGKALPLAGKHQQRGKPQLRSSKDGLADDDRILLRGGLPRHYLPHPAEQYQLQ